MHLLLQAQGDLFGTWFFPIAMFAVIVIFMILPQQRQRKRQKTFIESFEKGQRVVTSSGMLGIIDKVEDKVVTLNVGSKTYIRVTKNAISKELTDAIYPPAPDKA